MAMDENEKSYLSLRELQLVSLELLLEFDAFCKEKGLRYSLSGGTMLGAARHAGFIPWDDDIDVMMLREEYEKLLGYAKEIKKTHPQRRLVSNRDKSFARDYSRFIRLDYGKDERDISAKDCPWVGIDIFAIDAISDSQEDFEQQLKDRVFWREVVTTCASPWNAGSTSVKKAVRNAFRPVATCIGRFRAARKCEEICRRFENAGGKDIAVVSGMYGLRERWPRACYEPLSTLSFEGHELPVPHDYDTYMKAIYGQDYMQLPPEDKRKPGSIKAWKIEKE